MPDGVTGSFVTTSWSLISRARQPGDVARTAVAALCQQYWRPLYVYARRAGQSAEQAEDTIQEFLVHVIEDEVFARADAERGRFRTFILASLQQFLARKHRNEQRLKRTPRKKMFSLDVVAGERGLAEAVTDQESPAQAYERAWARAQLELTWARVGEEFASGGKSELYERLRSVVGGGADTPVREVAAALGMSEGAVNVAAHRMRRRFGELLRELVGMTVSSPEDVDDEIARLRAALAAV